MLKRVFLIAAAAVLVSLSFILPSPLVASAAPYFSYEYNGYPVSGIELFPKTTSLDGCLTERNENFIIVHSDKAIRHFCLGGVRPADTSLRSFYACVEDGVVRSAEVSEDGVWERCDAFFYKDGCLYDLVGYNVVEHRVQDPGGIPDGTDMIGALSGGAASVITFSGILLDRMAENPFYLFLLAVGLLGAGLMLVRRLRSAARG